MKKFKFYALAFAAIAFAGCSDDVIDGQGASGTQGDGTPAYLTISFTANGGNSSRSTADDANNTGDHDGNAEDSGHQNAGTTDEVAIKTALVVVAPESGSVGFAKLYTAKADGGDLTAVGDTDYEGEGFVITDNNTQKYYNANPIEVATGTYKVLVVINPVKDITDELDQTTMQLTSGPAVNALYDMIVDGKYVTNEDAEDSEITEDNPRKNVIDLGNGTSGFMMANKAEEEVTLTSNDTPEDPAQADVDVERVLSKITFRETTPTETNAKNVYAVDVYSGTVKAETKDGVIEISTGNYEDKTFNKAHDANTVTIDNVAYPTPNVVYALYEEGTSGSSEFKGVYRMTKQTTDTGKTIFVKLEAKTQEEYDKGTTEEKEGWFVAKNMDEQEGLSNDDIEKSLTLQASEEGTGEKTQWYVKLEGYALVNLSKEVYYVRHTTDNMGAGTEFGTLNGANFLYTPYFLDKNRVTFNEQTGAFESGADDINDWYYNTLAAVSEESATLEIASDGSFKKTSGNEQVAAVYYKPMSELGTEAGTVTGDKEQHSSQDTPSTLPNAGLLMSYCFENSTDITHQTHGLSTGISFVARIYNDPACGENNAITGLYRYAGHNFEKLSDIQKAYGANTPTGIVKLIEKYAQSGTPTKKELDEVGITQYSSNICYYYTTEIKHYDNGKDQELGNMEFAIMRNNIYSLAVTSIDQIGDPFVDPTPSIPNESDEAALSVSVNMIPWIVRYNDIEF